MTNATTRPAAEALADCGVVAVLEAAAGSANWLRGLRPLWAPVVLAGKALTVEAPSGDNLALHRALVECDPGVVLVVATGGTSDIAVFGELLAVALQRRGAAGIVTDGAVRDAGRLRELRFPVFTAAVAPVGPVKDKPGRRNVPVDIAGCEVAPGDWIVADEDGVVCLQAAALEGTLTRGCERRSEEHALLDRIRAGELTTNLLGFGDGDERED